MKYFKSILAVSIFLLASSSQGANRVSSSFGYFFSELGGELSSDSATGIKASLYHQLSLESGSSFFYGYGFDYEKHFSSNGSNYHIEDETSEIVLGFDTIETYSLRFGIGQTFFKYKSFFSLSYGLDYISSIYDGRTYVYHEVNSEINQGDSLISGKGDGVDLYLTAQLQINEATEIFIDGYYYYSAVDLKTFSGLNNEVKVSGNISTKGFMIGASYLYD